MVSGAFPKKLTLQVRCFLLVTNVYIYLCPKFPDSLMETHIFRKEPDGKMSQLKPRINETYYKICIFLFACLIPQGV